ncbi:hypothetical protein BD779DRAFT_1484488 [Infundibulicybe gibba]|nr:hypothetical protein BD779DRAFT_1484488 [Infundibulicybe gibba]
MNCLVCFVKRVTVLRSILFADDWTHVIYICQTPVLLCLASRLMQNLFLYPLAVPPLH